MNLDKECDLVEDRLNDLLEKSGTLDDDEFLTEITAIADKMKSLVLDTDGDRGRDILTNIDYVIAKYRASIGRPIQ